MWRNLIKTFERSIVLNSKQIFFKNNANLTNLQTQQRFIACSAVLRNTEHLCAVPPGGGEGDGEYIVPYKPEYERRDNAKKLIETLRSKFRLSMEDVEYILRDEVVLKSYRQKSLMDTLDTLCLEGVTKQNFVEYPWLITLDRSELYFITFFKL